MKQIKIALITLMLLGGINHSQAQFKEKVVRWWFKTADMLRPTPWTIGLGWNIVDDNGNAWKKIFAVSSSWNALAFPSAFKVEKYIDKGWSGMFNFAVDQYKVGKLINSDIPSTSSSLFMSFDLNAKYDFTELYDVNTKWFGLPTKMFDFYAASGFGYTYRNTARFGGAGTFNIGFGMNAIFYKGWGMNIQAMSKFGLASPFFKTPTNYLQYNFGAIYQFKQGHRKFGKQNGMRKKYYIKT